jgi:hypothetical protein
MLHNCLEFPFIMIYYINYRIYSYSNLIRYLNIMFFYKLSQKLNFIFFPGRMKYFGKWYA